MDKRKDVEYKRFKGRYKCHVEVEETNKKEKKLKKQTERFHASNQMEGLDSTSIRYRLECRSTA